MICRKRARSFTCAICAPSTYTPDRRTSPQLTRILLNHTYIKPLNDMSCRNPSGNLLRFLGFVFYWVHFSVLFVQLNFSPHTIEREIPPHQSRSATRLKCGENKPPIRFPFFVIPLILRVFFSPLRRIWRERNSLRVLGAFRYTHGHHAITRGNAWALSFSRPARSRS